MVLKFLNKEQKEFYDENGYILLDGIFNENETDQLSKEFEYLFKVTFADGKRHLVTISKLFSKLVILFPINNPKSEKYG